MSSKLSAPIKLSLEVERLPLAAPFRISGYTFENVPVLVVTLEREGQRGRGEAAGVYYKRDEPAVMLQQIEQLRSTIEAGISREEIQQLLPAGGARNALDCAMWALDARLCGCPVWQLAGLKAPQSVLTTFTCGADEPERMAAAAVAYREARAIKLKLTGEENDAERVRAVRAARPDVWLGVDANQGFTRKGFEQLMPVLLDTGVALIEQPFRVGEEELLDGLRSSIPIAADESAQSLKDIAALVGRFDVVNIKLDKCGGLTEGLAMARFARQSGLAAMVGNMIGTSLAMAPAYLIGQLCSVVDLDGPIFLANDRAERVRYADGRITCSEAVWA